MEDVGSSNRLLSGLRSSEWKAESVGLILEPVNSFAICGQPLEHNGHDIRNRHLIKIIQPTPN